MCSHCFKRNHVWVQLLLENTSSHWEKMTTISLDLWLTWYRTLITFSLILHWGNWFLPREQDTSEAFSYTVMFMLCMRACAHAWATIPCKSTLFLTMPWPRKCALLKHGIEHSHQSNNLDYMSQSYLTTVRIIYCECAVQVQRDALLALPKHARVEPEVKEAWYFQLQRA